MVYVTSNDITKIAQLKKHLSSHFQAKGLGYPKYFIGIGVV